MIEPRFLRPAYEQRRFCSIGSAILGVVGVGEATAAFAGPLLTAGIGAGVSAATGNNPLTGALIGGGVGALGAATGLSSSALGLGASIDPFTSAAAGISPGTTDQLAALGSTDFTPSMSLGNPASNLGTTSMDGSALANSGAPTLDTSGMSGLGSSLDPTVKSANDVATGGTLGKLLGKSGIDKTSLALGALAAGASALSKPQQYPVANVQSSLDVAKQQNQGPLWNAPLQMSGQKRQVQLPQDYNVYTAGFSPTPSFFNNNQLQFPTLPGQARGGSIGALNGHAQGGPEFSTRNGQHYVQGPGDGQSDDVKAALSDGEYVFDATTVSRLGNGSNNAGAQILDHTRKAIARDAHAPGGIIQKKIGPLSKYIETAQRKVLGQRAAQ